jgi:acyl carrier protein
MQGRPSLTDEGFGNKFFPPDRSEIAARLRQIMSRHIAVDLSRLHPDDLIVEDIRMDSLDSMATVEFLIEIEQEFGISVSDAEAEQMRTLRAVVDYVYEATRGSRPHQ